MANFWRDLRFGLRTLLQRRAFTAVCILTLGLGIGAATTIFTVVDKVVAHPFPYSGANRLAHFYVRAVDAPAGAGRISFFMEEFLQYRQGTQAFEDMIADRPISVIWRGKEGSVELDGSLLTANAFQFLGVPPLLGRMITLNDVQPGSPAVFAMSYRLWNSQFGSDPKLLGTTMTLNGQPRTLVAIMPPQFVYGDRDIWLPLPLDAAAAESQAAGIRPLFFYVLGKLKPGVSYAQASSSLEGTAHALAQTAPPQAYPKKFMIVTEPLVQGLLGSFQFMIYLLGSAVLMLLLIACGNVANLLLVNAASREKEMAIRASLGASYGRLMRQLMAEILLVAVAVCVTGVIFAYLGTKWAATVIPRSIVPAESVIQLDLVPLCFALLISMITTFLCGLAPALNLIRGNLYSGVNDSDRGSKGTGGRGRLRSSLVVAGVAFSVILLTATGLIVRTFIALRHVNLGFSERNVFAGVLIMPASLNDSPQQKKVFLSNVLKRLESLPGVASAANAFSVPPSTRLGGMFSVPGKDRSGQVALNMCSQQYFRTLEIPLVRGRSFSDDDIEGARRVAVINQSLTRAAFGDNDPIGQPIQLTVPDFQQVAPSQEPFEIIGVVGDVKNRGLRQPAVPEAFMPSSTTALGNRIILLKTNVDPLSLRDRVRHDLWAVDPNAVLGRNDSLETLIQRSEFSQTRFGLQFLSVFAIIGLALSSIGIFSLLAYLISLRKQEIGIRMALGARRIHILGMVYRKGIIMISIGILLGESASLALSRFISSQIWGVSAIDPVTFVAVAIVLLLCGVAGAVLPAERATQVEPISALRCE